MNNIIQLIGQKVKSEIEKGVVKVIEGDARLDNIVDSVDEMVNDIGINTITAIIEELNKIIKETPERKGKYHVHKSNTERTLITKFGELNFERTYYKNIKENKYVYILDQMLGIEKYERIEGNLKGDILENVVDVSYQKAAELSTTVPLSREAVKSIIRENGAIGNLELENEEEGKGKDEKKKVVDKIYIEADEDHVPMQYGKNRIMKLIYTFDGKKEVNRNRIELENVRYFTGEMTPEELWTEVATYLDNTYDLDKVNEIYIAGDGANWIKGGTEGEL